MLLVWGLISFGVCGCFGYWPLRVFYYLNFYCFLVGGFFGVFFGGEGFLDEIWGYIFHLFFGVVFFVCLGVILLFVFLKIYC